MARVRAVTGNHVRRLDAAWECAAVAAGAVDHPSRLDSVVRQWIGARVPGTAASAIMQDGASPVGARRDFDADDWWFRLREVGPIAEGGRRVLHLGGLATFADVWVDGTPVLHSENMFLEHEVDVTSVLRPESQIAIRFASLAQQLAKKRPRPRWRSQLLNQQQLRWFRTTLVGRIPGWTPPLAPVGPYRPVSVESQTHVSVVSASVRAQLDGEDGVCSARLHLAEIDATVEGVALQIAGRRAELPLERLADGVLAAGSVHCPAVARWWPHTHGEPALHQVSVELRTNRGPVTIDLGRTGFRTIEVDRSDDGFAFRINGVKVFCRGAVWTPLDVPGLQSPEADLRDALGQMRGAGMNMVRLGGTMTYEPAAFHDACDELGLLVWQDLMFATLDYPALDETFDASVRTEGRQLLDRLQLSPSLALVCGNSEVQQQAAMVGLPRSEWDSRLFGATFPEIVRDARPDVHYLESTPTGGPLPFRLDTGVSHYYGVGAFRRPLHDARRAGVRFAAECLGFGNVPCDETIAELMEGEVPTNHPRWKAAVPRDKGAGWDFDDVRDHYLREIFDVDPVALRSHQVTRYLQLGRVVTGEAMAAVMAEWRRRRSTCRGALVWLLRDFAPGAGWGLLDARGRRKAAYYILGRVLQPIAVFLTDEGLNGISVHVANDSPRPLEGRVQLVLYRRGEIPVAEAESDFSVPEHETVELHGDALLGRFTDSTYAYRFGPPGHDVVAATLWNRSTGELLSQAVHFPCGRACDDLADLGIEAAAEPLADGRWKLSVKTRRFAQNVAVEAPGFVPDDDFFHVDPRNGRTIHLRGEVGKALAARVFPLNASTSTKVTLLARSTGSDHC